MRKFARYLVLPPALLFFCGFSFVADVKNERGNRFYKKGQVGKAKESYAGALKSDPRSPEIAFNLGNAYYREDALDQAADYYQTAARTGGTPALLRSGGYYNLGNVSARKKDNPRAIEFYKQALRLNPKDKDAKYNLELLTQQSKNQQQQQKQQEQQQKQQQNQNQKQQQNQGGGQGQDQQQDQGAGAEGQAQQKQDKQDKGEGQQQQPRTSQGESEEKEQQQQKQEQGKEQRESEGEREEKEAGAEAQPQKSEADIRAEQILEALGNQEQQVLKMSRQKNLKVARRIPEKDW